jgi:hypothetical protein
MAGIKVLVGTSRLAAAPPRHRLGLIARVPLVALVAVTTLAFPTTASAAVSPSYAFSGYEIWATSTVGTFAGQARGADGDTAAWKASIEHTVQTIPDGRITGGTAELVTSDLTYIHGEFTGGRLWLVDDGEGSCGDLTHKVRGKLANVTRSDGGAIGTGLFKGRLIHYRAPILGQCIAYSASARGTIYLYF